MRWSDDRAPDYRFVWRPLDRFWAWLTDRFAPDQPKPKKDRRGEHDGWMW